MAPNLHPSHARFFDFSIDTSETPVGFVMNWGRVFGSEPLEKLAVNVILDYGEFWCDFGNEVRSEVGCEFGGEFGCEFGG